MVACGRAPEPLLVLGAMLPDFASMTGNRIAGVRDDRPRTGRALHHTTDEVFHRIPGFVSLCGESMSCLIGSGLSRGSARAVSHIGVEMVLDGLLAAKAIPRQLYDEALQAATSELVIESIEWGSVLPAEFWRQHIAALRGSGIPDAYANADFVTQRLYRLLAGRKRLALERQQLGEVKTWLRSVRPRVAERAEAIMAVIRDGLEADQGRG